jgi:S-adenosylmethionine decarboxylase
MLITQVLAELYGCSSRIEDAAALVEAARASAESVGATVVGEITVRYVPHGLTVAVFLAESHIVLTTWPEHRLLLVDVLLCNPQMEHRRVIEALRVRLCPEGRTLLHDVPRHVAAEPPAAT